MSAAAGARGRPGGAELVLLAGVALAALALRGADLGAAGVDHFDEGVYALSALALVDPAQPHPVYPEQSRFSPPLYFALLGGAYLLAGGPSDAVIAAVNVVMGTLGVLAVWWAARRWLGAPAAIAAAVLLTCSEFHIALSRSGLTDVSFAAVFVLALIALESAVARASLPRAALAGALVGLAWNTKYHGFFAALIAGAALAPELLRRLRARAPLRPPLLLFFVWSAVAALCYLPWALYVQSEPGGYLALARYQSGMLEPGYLANLWRQIEQQRFLDGALSRASLPLALAAAACLTPTGAGAGAARARAPTPFWIGSAGVAAAALALGGALASALGALVAAPLLALRRGDYAAWLLLAWLGAFLLSTPLYYPYARLVLPLTVASAVGCGAALAWLARGVVGHARALPALAALGLAVAVYAIASRLPDPSDPRRFSRGAAAAAAAIAERVPAGERVVVIGEPALAFHLHRLGRPAFERVTSPRALEAERGPLFVVSGVYAKRSRALREGLEALGPRLERLASFPLPVKDLRALDDLRPGAARELQQHGGDVHELTLFRLNPRAAGVPATAPAAAP